MIPWKVPHLGTFVASIWTGTNLGDALGLLNTQPFEEQAWKMSGVFWVRIKPRLGALMSVNWLNHLFYQPGLAVPSLKTLGQNGVIVPSCGTTGAQV